ncbi:TorD/DmsD family molecular chaperone [Streptomyces sp. BI20]|uniref:TorD/DmsD family molecular chaperone n=1 Tax=Streptomyces sp. BI20 TaxID=3403460 RepID=UPI003C78560D
MNPTPPPSAEALAEAVRELDATAAACTVVSRLLLEAPDQQHLDGVRDPELLADWPLPATGRTAEGLVRWADSRRLGEDASAVRADHNRLFVGPEALLAPPWESVHRSPEGLLFETETLQVRAWYARHGLAAPRQGREPDDHLGLELSFVAALSVRALDAVEAGAPDRARDLLAARRAFLDEHPLTWAGGFFDMIEEHARTAFHRGLAALGDGLLDHLGALPKDLDGTR